MITVLSHPDCLLHSNSLQHPESSERIKVIQNAVSAYPFRQPLRFAEAPLATKSNLNLVHAADYVETIFSMGESGQVIQLDTDTGMNPHSLKAALRAAGAVIHAVDLVETGQSQAVFCNIRPPGHHAEPDKAMGFCLFNNVAVGVAYALEKYALKRIAIIDFDVHHGNGTQAIFQDDPRVLYCSTFQDPFYPGYDPQKDNAHIITVPLAAGTTSAVFREAFENQILSALASYAPQLIFISAGFDAHVNDPLANLNLTCEDYRWMTKGIATIAKTCCQGKIISALEGGYDLAALRECVPVHIDALTADLF